MTTYKNWVEMADDFLDIDISRSDAQRPVWVGVFDGKFRDEWNVGFKFPYEPDEIILFALPEFSDGEEYNVDLKFPFSDTDLENAIEEIEQFYDTFSDE